MILKNLQSFAEIFSQWENSRKKKAPKKKVDVNLAMSLWLDKNKIPDKDEKTESAEKKVNWQKANFQAQIDLHGSTWSEAEIELNNFIDSARRSGKRKILVIHGKGIHSADGKSVLRANVRDFLENDARIGEFHECKTKDGGSGATWAVIRE